MFAFAFVCFVWFLNKLADTKSKQNHLRSKRETQINHWRLSQNSKFSNFFASSQKLKKPLKNSTLVGVYPASKQCSYPFSIHDVIVRTKLSTNLSAIHTCKVYVALCNTASIKQKKKVY